MKARRASDLAKSLIVDLDGVLAGVTRPVEDRHSAAASALILGARLIGGACVNLARIAAAAESIADSLEERNEHLHDPAMRHSQAERPVPHGDG